MMSIGARRRVHVHCEGGGGCIVRDVSGKMHCEEEEGVCEERRVYMIFLSHLSLQGT